MLRPLKNNLLVELIEKSKTTNSGLLLTIADPLEANKAKVLAVGDTAELVKVDEIILPDWNKAVKTKYEGVEYYIINEDDVVLVFD